MVPSDYTLKDKDLLYILPIGDIHLGSEDANLEYLDYWMDTVRRIKAPKRIYLMGDLVESATKRLANSSYRQQMPLDDQIEQTIQFFKPLKNDIVYSCMGNHEIRLSKDYDLDLNRIIANGLDCPYGNQHLDTFTVNGKPLTVYTAHGKGSSMYHYTAESKIIRDTQTINADIIMHGHNHRAGYFSIPTRTSNGLRRKHYMFTGAFLGYGGYADAMQLPILPEAFCQLRVNKDVNIRSELFYIDERRPDLMEGG
jgi:UDP-2,3-diacylglucosamine pyrophosphatase LpxH